MLKKDDSNIIVQNNFQTFWGISIRAYSKILGLCQERDSKKLLTDEEIDFHCLKNAEITRLAMVTIVFSCMTLESFINFYGTEKFSKSYYENYLDSLNLKSKWIVVPFLANGIQINTESEGFQLLGDLVSLRNKLVHDKTKYIKAEQVMDLDWIAEEDASMAVDAVKKIFIEFKKIDKAVDTYWIDKAENDPYV